MQPNEDLSFQLYKNHFDGARSSFSRNLEFKTTSHLYAPYFPKFSITTMPTNLITLCVKTPVNLQYVFYQNSDFDGTDSWEFPANDILSRQHVTAITFAQDAYEESQTISLLLGCQSGLIVYLDYTTDNETKIVRLYNYNTATKSPYKKCGVRHITILPKLGLNLEFVVVFEDSTAMRYKQNIHSENCSFHKKIKTFEEITSFTADLNRFDPLKSNLDTKHLLFTSYLSTTKQEFHHFYALNIDESNCNPVAYYKFNHRNISDLAIKKHPSFAKTALKYSEDQYEAILALTSLDGYLILYESKTMKPLLSYKGRGGGFNSLSFNENYEFIALSGPDEHITVLDLYTLTILRCVEGHRFFISRVIFQNIPVKAKKKSTNEDCKLPTEEKIQLGPPKGNEYERESQWMRIIGGGTDAMLSFWEFNTNVFDSPPIIIEENQFPYQLRQENIRKAHRIKPIHLIKTSDAVAWIEVCSDLLVSSGYDGKVWAFIISNIETENT